MDVVYSGVVYVIDLPTASGVGAIVTKSFVSDWDVT